MTTSPRELRLAIALVVAVVGATAWVHASQVDLRVALGGWSPIFWVYSRLEPAALAGDFSSGIGVYGGSLTMLVYPLAQRFAGIEPETLLPLMVCVEMAALALASAYLARALTPAAPPLAAAFVVLLMIASWTRTMDLARFAGPHNFLGLYYALADALRIFGLGLVLRNRIWQGALVLALSAMTHPVLGAITALFALSVYVGARPSAIRKLSSWGAAMLFAALTGGWVLVQFGDSDLAAGGVPAERWIAVSRAFSFHWYPIEIGVFTWQHWAHATPLLSFCLLLAHYLPRAGLSAALARGFTLGFGVMLGLSALGVLNASVLQHPALVKLALHRASDFIVVAGLPFVAWGLWRDMLAGSLWRRALALAIGVSPFLSSPGYPLALSLALVAGEWIAQRRAPHWRSEGLEIVLVICAAALPAIYRASGADGGWSASHYLGNARQYWVAGAALLAQFALARPWPITGRLVATVACLAMCAGLFLSSYQLSGSQEQYARSFKAAQLWARANTPTQAVFMVDPTIHYGWRDYSLRSSFGNMREWVFTNWLYDSRGTSYQAGLARLAEFGLSVDPYLNRVPPINGNDELTLALRERFYAMSDRALADIAARYRVSYIVAALAAEKNPRGFPVAYRNQGFVIYHVPQS